VSAKKRNRGKYFFIEEKILPESMQKKMSGKGVFEKLEEKVAYLSKELERVNHDVERFMNRVRVLEDAAERSTAADSNRKRGREDAEERATAAEGSGDAHRKRERAIFVSSIKPDEFGNEQKLIDDLLSTYGPVTYCRLYAPRDSVDGARTLAKVVFADDANTDKLLNDSENIFNLWAIRCKEFTDKKRLNA
jgi:hypothetical protein